MELTINCLPFDGWLIDLGACLEIGEPLSAAKESPAAEWGIVYLMGRWTGTGILPWLRKTVVVC